MAATSRVRTIAITVVAAIVVAGTGVSQSASSGPSPTGSTSASAARATPAAQQAERRRDAKNRALAHTPLTVDEGGKIVARTAAGKKAGAAKSTPSVHTKATPKATNKSAKGNSSRNAKASPGSTGRFTTVGHRQVGTGAQGAAPLSSAPARWGISHGQLFTARAASKQHASSAAVTTGSISGTITDSASHAAIPGACATVYLGFGNSATSCADASGNYTVTSIPAGQHVVQFNDNLHSHISQYWNNEPTRADPVTVVAGSTTTGINAAMVQGGSISGTVTASGSPLANVCATLYSDVTGDYSDAGACTDSAGHYQTTGVPAGTYDVVFDSTGPYVEQWYNAKANQGSANAVSVSVGAVTSSINAAMQRAGSISGKVTDAATSAAISACLDVYSVPSDNYAGTACTDASGNYTTPGLATGTYALYAYDTDNTGDLPQWYSNKADFAHADAVSVTFGSDTAGKNLALARGGSITGAVADSSTNAAIASVCARAWVDANTSINGGCTDATGHYTIAGLPTGSYKISFAAQQAGYLDTWYHQATSFATGTTVSVTQPAATTASTEKLDKGASISGTVTDASTHAGIGSVSVAAQSTSPDGTFAFAETDSSGSYTVVGLPTDTYTVCFSDDSGTGHLPQCWNNSATGDPVSVTAPSARTGINAAMKLGGTVSGTVTDAVSHSPVGGIDVQAISVADQSTYAEDETRSDGTYSLTGLPTGSYVVEFANLDPVYLTQWWNNKTTQSSANPISVTAGATSSNVNAALNRGATISGTVSDATSHAAIWGAYIEVFPASATDVGSPSATATSNKSGAYAVTGLPSGHYKLVVFDAPGGGHLSQWWNGKADQASADQITINAPATATVNLGLSLGASISGTVTDAATNSGVGGVDVTATSLADQSSYDGTTNADGTYTVVGLPSGSYQVEFVGTAVGYINQWWNNKPTAATADTVALTAPNVRSGVNAQLALGGSITGTVTDASTHQPLSGIEVDVYDSRDASTPVNSVATDGLGNYSVGGLLAGTYFVSFDDTSGSYGPQWWNNQPNAAAATAVTVAAGTATHGVNAALVKAGSLSGTVTDATSGAPIDGVCVNVFLASDLFNSVAAVCTGPDGTYSVGRLFTGQYMVKFIDPTSMHVTQWYNGRPSSGTADVVRVNNGANTPAVNAAMARGGWITGTVTDASTHAPIPGLCVNVFQPTTSTYVGDTVCTDDSGNYQTEGLPAGDYQVVFDGSNGANTYEEQWYNNQPSQATANSVHVVVGSATANINAAMVTGSPVSGTVTSAADGTGVNGVQVLVVDAGSGGYITSVDTNPDGTWTSGGLLPGTYKVQFVPQNNSSLIPQWFSGQETFDTADPVTVASAPVTGIDAVLQVGGTVAGTITDAATGLPISGICAYVDGSYLWSACSGADGTYLTPAVPPGGHDVTFVDQSGPYLTQDYANEPVTVTSGQTTSGVDAAMVQGATFSGTVTDVATGVPLANVCVSVTDIDGNPLPSFLGSCAGGVGAQTDASGHFTTPGVPAGTYKVDFTNFGGRYIEQWYSNQDSSATASQLTVTLGTNTPNINAAMQLGGIVSGRVTAAATGAPVPDVCITLLKPADGSFGGNGDCTDSAGDYVSAAVRPGTYKVQFTDESGQYDVQYYNRKADLASANTITVTAGSNTSGIDAVLGATAGVPATVCGVAVTLPDAAPGAVHASAVSPDAATAGAQLAELTATGGGADDALGSAVAVSGSTAAVGAPGANGGKGEVFVFTRKGTAWSQSATLTATDGAVGDGFGSSVAVAGSTVVVGASQHTVGGHSGQGAAYVFSRKGKTWSQAAELAPSGAAAGDRFGCAVAVTGSTVVIGAIGRDLDRGAAFVFKKKGSSWTQAAEVDPSDGAAGDLFGASVAIAGSTIAVGAFEHAVGGAAARGAAYVFKKKGSAWNQSAELVATDGAAGDWFGDSVAAAGSTIVVGASRHAVGIAAAQGVAYVFARKATSWSQAAELHAPDGAANDLFGGSVAVSGSLLVVGARGHAIGTSSNRGSAYVFAKKKNAWGQVAEPTASDGADNDAFGWAVALQGKTVVIGAPQRTVGPDAGQGTAYVFQG